MFLGDDVLIALVDRGVAGIHRLTNSGQCSRYDFACAIAEHTEYEASSITPVPSSECPTVARRPGWSVLQSDESQMRPWRAALAEFLG